MEDQKEDTQYTSPPAEKQIDPPEPKAIVVEEPAVVAESEAPDEQAVDTATTETSNDAEQEIDSESQLEVLALTPPVAKGKSIFAGSRRWVIIGVALLLAVAAGIAYWATRPSTSKDATSSQSKQVVTPQLGIAPTLMDGVVEYSTNGTKWSVLTDKVTLKTGNQVRTGADGRVVLTLDDGSAVRLGYGSAVKLTSLAVKSVEIDNLSGEVYSRVIASATRTYTVSVDDTAMVAKGTAFRTLHTDSQKGVEVYQSTVQAGKTDVTEGKAYFTANSDQTKKDKVSDIDLSSLKGDAFIQLNVGLDKQMTEAKDKLGVLTDIDKPAASATTATTQKTTTTGIVLGGSLSGNKGKFTWTVSGVSVTKGFKLVRSTATKYPVYPGNDYQYASDSNTRSMTWSLEGGKTYYFRICAYRGDSCDSYSNTVTLTTPAESNDSDDKDELVHGTVSLTLNDSQLSWTMTGTAPNGYKVVAATHENPEYPTDGYLHYGTETSFSLSGASLTSGVNYIRVCKYVSGGCTDYSNQITYTKQ